MDTFNKKFLNKFIDKDSAIEIIRSIQNGECGCFDYFPEELKGEIAKNQWHDEKFSYGMEYGLMLGLILAFNITVEEING